MTASPTQPLTIALDMTIAGDAMTLDFSRSSPPCAGPLNIAYSTAVACCYVALKHVFTDVPANAGCLAPIRFVIPDTTLLGVKAPKPVGGYTETILRVIGVVFGAIAKAAPERAIAAPFGTINALSLAGHRDDGSRWVMFSFFGGGLGATPGCDGLSHGNNPISMATIPPVEILEASYPVMFTQWALRPDSAGAGTLSRRPRRRSTRSRRWPTAARMCSCSASAASSRRSAPGAAARRAQPLRLRYARRARAPPLASKVVDVEIAKGQRVRLETPGGGGCGAAKRDARPEREVARDVRLGYCERRAGAASSMAIEEPRS